MNVRVDTPRNRKPRRRIGKKKHHGVAGRIGDNGSWPTWPTSSLFLPHECSNTCAVDRATGNVWAKFQALQMTPILKSLRAFSPEYDNVNPVALLLMAVTY